MTETLGRITGHNVTEIHIRTYYGATVQVGEILVAEDLEHPETLFLLRVYDLQYGFEAKAGDWNERTAGTMMEMDISGEEMELHDKERRLFKLAICTPLGCVRDGAFHRAKTIPAHFSRVRQADDKDYEVLREFMGDVMVGDLRSGEKIISFPVGIVGADFPSHVGVFATTGMGKSNLMKRIAGSVMELGRYGLLILDPHGEYYDGGGKSELKGLLHHPLSRDRLEVFSARDLSGPFNRIKISAHEVEVDDLMQLYDFSDAQLDAFSTAKRVFGPEWLVNLLERDMEDLMMDMPNTFEGTIGVIKRRLQNLFRFDLLTRDSKISITSKVYDLLKDGKVVLVDTSNMYEAEELLVSIVLARGVFTANKKAYGDPKAFSKIPPMLISLEEAQRILGRLPPGSKHKNIFAQVAREGRKFNTGLCAISQQPKLIDEEVLSQFNTLFILGLADRKDRSILKDSAKQDVSALDNEIQMLEPGEAIITSPTSPFAVPVKIHLYEDYVASNAKSTVEVPDDGDTGDASDAVGNKPKIDSDFF